MILRASPHALARRDGDELLVFHRATGDYLSISGAGVRMWELLTSGRSRDEALASLLAELDVDDATAARDLDAFVADLSARGLVEVTG